MKSLAVDRRSTDRSRRRHARGDRAVSCIWRLPASPSSPPRLVQPAGRPGVASSAGRRGCAVPAAGSTMRCCTEAPSALDQGAPRESSPASSPRKRRYVVAVAGRYSEHRAATGLEDRQARAQLGHLGRDHVPAHDSVKGWPAGLSRASTTDGFPPRRELGIARREVLSRSLSPARCATSSLDPARQASEADVWRVLDLLNLLKLRQHVEALAEDDKSGLDSRQTPFAAS
jgi:hypothetical protein